MTIHKIELTPDQTGYGVDDFGSNLIRVQHDGAAGTYSRNIFNNAVRVTIRWICSEEEYNYIAACERYVRVNGGAKFKIDLLLDEASELIEYLAQFVPGSFALESIQGETFYVVATLEIDPEDYDTANNPFVVDPSLADRRIRAQTALFNFFGQPSKLRFSFNRFIANTARFQFIGTFSKATVGKLFNAASATFTFTPKDTSVRFNRVIKAEKASFAFTANDAAITKHDPVLPLDDYPTGFAAIGVKRLVSSYTGPLARVSASSSGGTEYDVTNPMSLTELESYVGAGNTAYITKMYDQFGNGNHFVPDNGRMRLCAGGVLYGAIYQPAGTEDLLCVNNAGATQYKSFFLNIRGNACISGATDIPVEYGDASQLGTSGDQLQLAYAVQNSYTPPLLPTIYFGHGTGYSRITSEYGTSVAQAGNILGISHGHRVDKNGGITGTDFFYCNVRGLGSSAPDNDSWDRNVSPPYYQPTSIKRSHDTYFYNSADFVGGGSSSAFGALKWRIGRRTDGYGMNDGRWKWFIAYDQNFSDTDMNGIVDNLFKYFYPTK